MNFKILVLILLSLFLSSCHNGNQQRYQGYVEGENLYLTSPYSGTLIEALVQRGEQVKKGQLLFKLDDNPQLLNIKQAKALLIQAQKQLDDLKKPRRPAEIDALVAQVAQVDVQIKLAALRVKRSETLVKKNALDQDTLDAYVERLKELNYLKAQYEANLALAREGSRVDQIQAQHAAILNLRAKTNLTEWELTQKSIYAPADGVIFDTYFRKGEWVDSAHAIAAFLEPENIRIEFFVPVEALSRLHLNQAITFDCDGCGKSNHASINYISPEAEYVPPLVYSRENNDKLVFRVKARLNEPGRFKPGQPVIVTVSTHD